MLLLVILLASAYGVGIGMAIAIWLMASEPCSDRRSLPHVEEDALELKQSA